MSKKFLTTPIYYANAKPHIGAAFTDLITDTYKNLYTLLGHDVEFVTGLDEHGLKVFEKAESLGKSPKEHVDTVNEYFLEMEKAIKINPTMRVRTSSEAHKKSVQEIWKKLEENGDIYKAEYEGLYCVGSESFILEKDLDENGLIPLYGVPPKVVKEENYFFKLSKYIPKVKELLESGEIKIYPEFRKKEILNMADSLQDISFSRPKDSVKWGIPVPNDDSQLMYVWCDALCNYITCLGYPENNDKFNDFWPASWHFMAKEITKFHAIFWPAMCLSLGISLPKKIAAHGHITVNGVKMSKSLGNVIDPLEILEEFDADVLRYALLREMLPGNDFDFSKERLIEVYNTELASKFGNAVSRVFAMGEKYMGLKIDKTYDLYFQKEKEELLNEFPNLFEEFEIRKAIELWLKFAQTVNQLVEEKKPWELAKNEEPGLPEVMYNLIEGIRVLMTVAQVFLPNKTATALSQIGSDFKLNFDPNYKLEASQLHKPEIMFHRLDLK